MARTPEFTGLLAALGDEVAVARLERAATIGRPFGVPASSRGTAPEKRLPGIK